MGYQYFGMKFKISIVDCVYLGDRTMVNALMHCVYIAGNGQWPGGQMCLIFVWGHQISPNYGLIGRSH